MPDVSSLLEGVLSSLPEGANPFTALAEVLHSFVYSSSGPGFAGQVWMLCGLLGIVLIASISALVLRFVRSPSEFWLFKRTVTTGGIFIIPNSSVCFLILNSCYIAVFFPYAYYGLAYSSGSGDLRNLILWKTVVFIPLWEAAWVASWGTALSGNLRQSPLLSSTGGPLIQAWIMNSYFILSAVLLPFTIVPLCALSSTSWNRAFNLYERLHDALLQLGESWTGGAVDLDGPAVQMAQDLVDELGHSMHWFKAGWAVWSGWGLLLVCTIVPSTLLYVHTLRSQIRAIQPVEFIETGVNLGGGFSSGRKNGQQLNRAYKNLLATSISLCLVVSIYTGVALWTSVDAVRMLESPKIVQISYLVALYPYVVFAGTAVILLLVRSLARPPPSSAAPFRLSALPFGIHKPNRGRKPSEDSFKTRWEKKKSLAIQIDQSIFQVTIVDRESETIVDELQVDLPNNLEEAHYDRDRAVPVGWSSGKSRSEDDEIYIPPDSPFFGDHIESEGRGM
ncbi:hypothetical protein RQP46_010583 [Phenoliferia psychrophenolica]